MTEKADRLEAHLSEIVRGQFSPVSGPASDPDLDPLLAVAKRLQEIGAMAPSPAAVQRVRLALRRGSVPESRPSRTWWPRLATAMPVAIVLMVISTLTALAAPSALPDSPLYGVRNVRETLEVRLAGTPAQRAALYVTFARQRADQLRRLTRVTGASSTVISTLLRDISSRVAAANGEAREDGAAARAALQPSEGQIETELTQIQNSATLSPDGEQQLDTTIQDVESSESTTAPDSSPAPEATSTP